MRPSPPDERAADAAGPTFERLRAHVSPAAAFAAKFAGSGAIEARAEGATVTLSDGRRLVDFGSYAVTLLGHRPPTVVDAVRCQLDVLPTSTRILANEAMPTFAEHLCDAIGADRLRRVWLGCNGSDAVEASLKLARLATGRPRVVALEGAYHGKSMGALAVTHNARYRASLEELLVGTAHVGFDVAALEAELARGDVAAFIFEPLQGEGGMRPVPLDFLRRAVAAAHASGALVIADEIQMGLGRCGAISLAEAWGLEADSVLFGKVLGGGVMPLSAAVCTDEFYAPLLRDSFLHTVAFSGHPLACAAGSAGLALLDTLLPRAPEIEAWLHTGLTELAGEFPDVVAEARGRGLAWGLECRTVEAAGHVMAELTASGLVHSPCLGRPEVLRLLPPLVATRSDVDAAMSALRTGFGAARGAAPADGRARRRRARASVDEAGVRWVRVEEARP